MHPHMNRSRLAGRLFLRLPIRTALKVLILMLSVSVPFALYVRVASVASDDSPLTIDPIAEVTVHAAGRGKPFMNLQDGRKMSVEYRGAQQGVAALQNGAAQGRALAAADFDRNGTPDVVAGYSLNGAGMITVHRGNPDGFAPADDSVLVRIQNGYNPASLLPAADVYMVPVSPDFLLTGNFTHDSESDVLFAVKGGGLYLMAGDGTGRLGDPQQIALPGPVTALAAGEFRAADGFTDIAVGVSGPGGESVLIFDAVEGLSSALVQYQLSEPASGIELGGLDDDPFMDVAVAAGNEILVVHGWGRKEPASPSLREQRINVGPGIRGLAIGHFTWDRQGRSELAVLSEDGAVRIIQKGNLDVREFSEAEAAERTRGKLIPQGTRLQDVESVPGWRAGRSDNWVIGRTFMTSSSAGAGPAKPLLKTNLSFRETEDLMVVGGGNRRKLEILRSIAPKDKELAEATIASESSTSLDVEGIPVAVLTLPKKINGTQDVVILDSVNAEPVIVPNAPNTTITVDRTDDPAGAGLTAASACTANPSDCSLRGALQFANLPTNDNTTINLPANTYVLSINGTSQGGCDGNTVGDLGANRTMSIVGAGAATTIIRQTGTGPGNDGDRIMCMNEVFTVGLIYNFSGVSFVGGREGVEGSPNVGAALGGAGIIGGELNNSLTLTNVVIANNQGVRVGDANLGGGGLQITGGNLIITNSTFGGSSAPGAYTDRSSTNTGNAQVSSGGGLVFTPSSPQHSGGSGTLTVTGSTFSRNTSTGIGGGGADLLIFAFASPGGIGSGSASIGTSTFSNNSAANGGGIIVESLPTTITSSTNFNTNSASNRGGGIYVGGGSLLLNGAALPAITFSGNTATSGGSSIVTTGAPVNVDGTNTTIGGDIEINTGGSWTNNAGSSLAPTNVLVNGGTFNMNNSTMNVSGNLTIQAAPLFAATFNGGSGTVNIQGNFAFTAGGAGATFNAGTGTFNFNGTGSQSISNTASITFFNLTNSNVTNPLTLNNSLAVNGSLNVNGVNAILSPVAAVVISGTGTLTGTGTARASRIAATPDFLSQYTITNKTLTNLQIDYNGAGTQTVNNTPAYSRLMISGSGTKTLQGNTVITSNLNIIAGSTFAGSTFNFALGGNWTNGGTFTPGTGTVTFAGTTGIQTLTGNTTFFNLTLNNGGATTNFSNTTTTVGNDLVASAGTMDGGTSTIIFTGVTDSLGSISGVAPKNFHNLQINSPATISNSTGGNITIEGNYSNAGTFTQAASQTTIFDVDNAADGAHTLSGVGPTTFGNFTINASNTVNAGSHNFNVVGAVFNVLGTFTGNTSTVSFTGVAGQGILGDGNKNFSGLLINSGGNVNVGNSLNPVDATVSGLLTLTTDLTVASGGILQQSGTSAGAGDVLGTVRRTDLAGGAERSFGNLNNSIQINSGTAPTQMDFNLVKVVPTGFPATVKVVPRTYTLSPTGGAGISATVKLRYIDPAELTGPPAIPEANLILWKDITGSDAWTPQGGTPNTVNNFVSLSGVSSFSEWAIAEGSDLTLTKANNTSNAAVTGQAWNWTLTATNTGAPATFTAGQTIISDNLPNSNVIYGTPTVQNATNITGSANISCSIVSNDLTCTASGGNVTFDSNIGASSFQVVFSATPQAVGSYQNPRTGGGIAQIDPNNVVVESNETNNSPANNTVTVAKANTTTAINSGTPDPSVVGQLVTVTWSVTVNAPGAVGAPLTGNVTVSDGTDSCVAAVSAGQCDITFTSAGAKSITATYAGDTNYNGSASTPATAHTVNAANTTTTITEDNPDPSTPGQAVLVKYTVTVDSPGSGTPTGTVTVSDGVDSNNTCTVADGVTGCSLTLNTNGNRTITATYVGNANFATSNDTEDHQVCGATTVTTNADSGAGSLRQVIADACDGATIDFAVDPGTGPHTITLTTGELVINKNLTIQNTSGERITVSGNVAGRVFNINSGKTAAIIGLTITGGNSAQNGGAILNDGTLTVVNSTLTGNLTAIDGGAISSSATSTSLTLINTTVSGNDANGFGGGVDVLGGTVTIINSTITGNRGDFDDNTTGGAGGVRRQGGTVTLHNTIVAGNSKGAVTPVANDIEGTVEVASANNLIGDASTSGGLTHGVSGNIVGNAGSGTIVLNTVIGALADNGGLTNTHALVSSGPAVEAGNNANLPVDTFDLDGDVDTAEALPLDQRGLAYPRVADSADANTTQTVDIGAFELHPSIEDIGNQATNENTVKNVTFNLGDDTGSLISTVTATSSNTTLVPNAPANLSFTGSGGSRTLQITPAANQSGSTTITVTVTATNGRTATDTFDLTVNAVNDPPSGTDNTVITAEDTAYTFTAADFGFTDPNDAPPNTLLAVKITTLPGVGALTNNNVAVNAGDFIPVADINGGLLKFTPVANANGTPYTSFTFQVQDNGGGSDLDPTPNTMTINVTAVNDPPSFTIAADPPSVSQDAGPQTVLNFATSISQGAGETGQVLTFNVSPTVSTGTLTFSTAPAIDSTTGTLTYTPTNGTNGTATFSVTLSDNGSNTPPNSNTSGAQTFTITVFPPNATPVVTTTAGNLAYTENDPATAIDPGLTVTDSDTSDLTGATVSITAGFVSAQDTLAFTNQLGITGNYNSGTGVLTLTGTTSVANYQTALRTVTYHNSSDAPTSSRTITFSATDSFTTGSATRGIAISAVNDGPVNTVPGAQSTNEDTAKVFSSGNGNQISVADVDLGANPIKITLTATNGSVTLSGITGLSFTTGDGTDDATMVFTGMLADVNTALSGLSFNPTADFSGAASLQIVSDDQGNSGTGGAKTDTDVINITVNAANDVPVVTTTGGSLSYTENDAATVIDPGLTVTDVDSTNLTGATVAITTNFAGAEDVLAFTNQLGITGNYDSGTGVLTLTGTTTVANYQTALRSVTYQNTSENPSPLARTVTFTVNDGTDTGSATRGITVNGVNDAPVNTVPAAQGTIVDAPLTFSSGNSNQISVADGDAGGSDIQVALTASNGTFTLSGVTGLSFTVGDGTADAAMTFTGTIANINNALNGLVFTPDSGFSGAASLQIVTNDLGNTGSGGAQADTDTINISVTATLALTVNTTGDEADANVGDSICDVDLGTGGAQCTLRAAIQEANAVATADTIGFSLPASSTIELTSALPAIAGDLDINGPTNKLTIDGNSTGRVFEVTSGTVSIDPLTITGGLVNGGHGGGLLVTGGDVTLKDLLFTANTAINGNGGGVAITGGSLTILNTTLSGNTATNGGGVYLGGGSLIMTNVTVTNNTANGDTGSGPTATGDGGGVHIGANPTLVRNSIIAGNIATTNPNVSGTLGLGNNLVSGNPLLAPLADNGGPTMTHALLAGSPALDAGNDTHALNAGLTNDQRGFDRITDGNGDTIDTVDIGAFEAQVFLEDIADRAIDEDSSDSFSFNVGGAAAITNVTATSSNTALVPNSTANLDVTGAGGTRTLTITPVVNGFGSTTITVTVESASGSMTDTFLFTVNPVNDPPVFTGGPNVVVNEDAGPQTILNWATGISPGPANESTQTLTFLVSNGNNSLFSVQPAIASNGTLTFTPAANATGVATVSVQLQDNGGGTDSFPVPPLQFTITVNAVNDPPTFTGGPNQTVNEDAGPQTVLNWATGISPGPADESGQTLTFLVSNGNNSLFSVQPAIATNGTLTYTPAANASGVATVSVQLQDNGGGTDSSPFPPYTFTITVNAVNDAPSFTKGPNQTVNEDAGAQSVANWATAISAGPADESGQTVAFNVTNDNNALFSVQPAVSPTGTLTYTPAPDANGTATVSVSLTDNGGTANGGQNTSAVQTFTITVNAVNDGPVNTVPGAQSLTENGTLTFSAGNGNQISIADVDAGAPGVQVTLTATNGTVTLAGTAGLAFSVGDGTADPTMTFTGTVASINTALNGLVFTPTSGFDGAASLQIVTNDLGNTGSGGALSDTDTVNITVNDGGTLQFSSATYSVNENAGTATITVNRTGGTAGTTTVDFTTSNGTATAGVSDDYLTSSGTLTFGPGVTSQSFTVTINNDPNNEANETVNLTLSNVTGSGSLGSPSTAVLTIIDNDIGFGLSASSYTVGEGSVNLAITVNRLGDATLPASVEYSTSDLSAGLRCEQFTGVASERCDYSARIGVLAFAAGQSSAVINIPVIDDVHVEGPETFNITLSNPIGAVLGTPLTAVITITDNDTVFTQANPIDTFPFYVRMQYLDFLEREPDAIGFAYWLDRLNTCAANPSCNLVQERIQVSAGFFYSNEFLLRKGYFIYRFYRASLGRAPTYHEFVKDMAAIGAVDADEDARRAAFTLNWVTRPDFMAIYNGLSDTDFVDQLVNTAGVNLNRPQLVAELQGGKSRAQLVRDVAENVLVYDKYFREAFVTTQYFGYLKRDPDAIGFAYWMDRVNLHPNDFRLEQHPEIVYEVVGGFIYSEEYQLRFGNRNY